MINILFTYRKSDNQSDTFTRQHTRFDVSIETARGVFKTTYQCNTDVMRPNKLDVLECLLSDAEAFEMCPDKEDFVFEFGYTESPESLRKGYKAYEGCKRTYYGLHNIFTYKELEELAEQIYGDYED